MKGNISNKILILVCFWLITSSFYYFDTLVTGLRVYDIENGFFSKIIKYIICASISLSVIVISRRWSLLGVMLSLGVLLIWQLMLIDYINIFSTNIAIIFSMMGFVCIVGFYPEASKLIASSIVFSAAIVGFLSLIELTVLADNFVAHWSATGRVRSISSLFNPNNLGIYLGASILILPLAINNRFIFVVLIFPILFGLVMSGSRTAWISLSLFLIVKALMPNSGRGLRTEFKKFKLSFFICAYIFILFVLKNEFFVLNEPGGSLSDASFYIRIRNFIEYLNLIGVSNLIPDFYDKRSHLVQDNFYLMYFNTFGLILILVQLLVIILGFRRVGAEGNGQESIWLGVVIYYLIAGLAVSFINAFPNNQLFFLALGGAFVQRNFSFFNLLIFKKNRLGT